MSVKMPLGHQTALNCIMPSPVRSSAGGDLFPHYSLDSYGENMIQKPTKSRDTVVQKYLLSFVNRGASQSGEPSQGAIFSANLQTLSI